MIWLNAARTFGSAISKLQQEQGANYSRDSLCSEMNLSEEELTSLMEEARPVELVSLDESATGTGSVDHSLHEIIPDDCCISAADALERKEPLSLG